MTNPDGLPPALKPWLERLDLPAPPLRAQPRRFGKWVIELRNGAGMVKLATTAQAAASLAVELATQDVALPRQDYCRPHIRALAQEADWAALWLEYLPMRNASRLQALRRRPGPFETLAGKTMPLAVLLPGDTGNRVADGLRQFLRQRHGAERVPTAPSHGDFVYWNTGSLPDGRRVLLDFERYAAMRSLHFDRIFWTIVPLARQATRQPLFAAGLLAAAPNLSLILAPDGRLGMALMLAEHAAMIAADLSLGSGDPHIEQLNFNQLIFYEKLMHRLLP